MPRESLDGVRRHIILTKPQERDLAKLSKQTRITISEHIRRAVDVYLAQVADRLSTKER